MRQVELVELLAGGAHQTGREAQVLANCSIEHIAPGHRHLPETIQGASGERSQVGHILHTKSNKGLTSRYTGTQLRTT